MFAVTDWTGIALVITATAGLVTALGSFLVNGRRIRDVQRSVDTGNTTMMGALVQEQFGHASLDVDPALRTADERDSVAMLSDQARATHAKDHPT